jgi:hypothetical protein
MAEEQIAPASPLPWHVGPHYKTDIESQVGRVCEVGRINAPACAQNARYIVLAANAYPHLVAALQVALSAIEQGLPYVASEEDYVAVAERTVRAALALAEGR